MEDNMRRQVLIDGNILAEVDEVELGYPVEDILNETIVYHYCDEYGNICKDEGKIIKILR